MQYIRSRGFTLIELLVVIAIIGILSAVVLASLNTARNRANDAKVQAQLASMRAAMEVYYSGNNNYGTSVTTNQCGTTPASPWNDTASGLSNLGNTANYPTGTTVTCITTGSAWGASASLNAGGFYCADSTGAGKTVTGTTNPIGAADTVC